MVGSAGNYISCFCFIFTQWFWEANLLPPGLSRSAETRESRPAVGRRPTVLATNRNGGKLRLNASHAGRKEILGMMFTFVQANSVSYPR